MKKRPLGYHKKERILLGLEIMSALRVPESRFTAREIAKFCGCSMQNIVQVEAAARRKVKRAITQRAMEAGVSVEDYLR
jgi:hypothetical protein